MDREGSDIKRYPAILWGYAIKDSKVTAVKNKKAEFTVKFGASQNVTEHHKEGSGYRNCEAWGDTDVTAVMEGVEKDDEVVCFGEWKDVKYEEGNLTKKKKQKKDYHVFTCHAVISARKLAFLEELYNSPTIQKILDGDRNDAPDPFESADDEYFGF